MKPETAGFITAHSDIPNITDRQTGALVRAVVGLFRKWNLGDSEACVLLGDMPRHTWNRWKIGDIGDIDRIDHDLRMRMAHLMGIHKGLRCIFIDPARGYAWIRKPNKDFDDNSALDVMMSGKTDDLAVMRGYLNVVREG